MEKNVFISHYCQNYKRLEKKVIESGNYVSIEKQNNQTFSAEFIFLFVSICSELDSLAGEYCKMISPDSDTNWGGIVKKIDIITEKHDNLRNNRIDTKFPYERQSFVPFLKLEENTSSWWTDYNRVKHNRTEKDENDRFYYQRANLKNVLSSLAALYIMICFIGKEFSFDEPPVSSELFEDEIVG